jgi:integrase
VPPGQRRRVHGNGEGSVYQRKDGRIVAALVLPDGKRVVWYVASRREGRAVLAEARRAIAERRFVAGDRVSVQTYLTDWLEAARPNLRYAVWVRYGEYLRLHALPAIGAKRLQQLGPLDLQRLYAARLAAGLSPTTVRHLHAVLHRALADAVRLGQLPSNPVDRVQPPRRATRERPTLSAEQAKRLCAVAEGHRLGALVVCALTLGLREGELLGLRWECVDLERGTLAVAQSLARQEHGPALGAPKTPSSRRTLRLPRVAADALTRRRQIQRAERLAAGPTWQEHGLVFTRPDGRPVAAQHVAGKLLAPLLDAAGLPRLRLHDLRHTYATLGLRQHVPLRLVSDALGHASIAITADLYSHVTEELQQQVADAIDALFDADS